MYIYLAIVFKRLNTVKTVYLLLWRPSKYTCDCCHCGTDSRTKGMGVRADQLLKFFVIISNVCFILARISRGIHNTRLNLTVSYQNLIEKSIIIQHGLAN